MYGYTLEKKHPALGLKVSFGVRDTITGTEKFYPGEIVFVSKEKVSFAGYKGYHRLCFVKNLNKGSSIKGYKGNLINFFKE